MSSDYPVRQTMDVDAVRRLDQAIFVLDGDEPVDIRSDSWLWLARDPEGAPCGYGVSLPLLSARSVLLERAGVLWHARGRGLHRRLIRARVNAARKWGALSVITYTLSNPASANNLIREGFVQYMPENPWAGKKGVQYWIKELAHDL